MTNKIKQYETIYNRNKDKYIKYIRECLDNPNNREIAWNDNFAPYLDIDDVYGSHHDFYYDLEQYLNLKNIKSKYKKRSGIKIFQLNLRLRSDQLGFSAPHKSDIAWSIKYPYAKYLSGNGKIELVADILWNTRSLGGSFLWPIVYGGSIFNRERGVGSYIEDRADLTLWEIKKFYEYLKESESIKKSKDKFIYISSKMKENKYILLKNKDGWKIYLWLKYFEDFNKYIDYFSFKDDEHSKEYNFCDKYGNIRNLTNDTTLNDQYVNDLKNNNKRVIKNELTINEIEYMLNKLNGQILERARIMEGIINGETNKE